ncbi:MAG: DbpA RNA binding domain-containing protein [Treponema sp.]|jgi:hypothetical protein|nr:DbpA RNA binding domain-containing protein [Treponema sp.]
MSVHIDKEKTKQTIAFVLDKMRTEADPWLLEEYQSLFKKEVSLFQRSKAAAYLLMLCEQGKNPRFGRAAEKNSRKTEGGKRFREEDSAASKEPSSLKETERFPTMSEEESKRLFFSVGRSRRVYPREILGLINSKTDVPREDIGSIRILDNYSFVQVRDTVAEKIIESLNGLSFRGRPLTVNYAKSRESDNPNEASEQGASSNEDEDHSEEENI